MVIHFEALECLSVGCEGFAEIEIQPVQLEGEMVGVAWPQIALSVTL